jgi:type IV pilus assembly protein PilX
MSRLQRPAQRAQRGVILFIALIVLVAMSLAGVALMRSVDTNVLIAGNLAFRQATTALGDNGIEAARSWMSLNNASLVSNQPGGNTGYWANWQAGLDFTGATAATSDDYPWDTEATAVTSPDPAYAITYVIHRLCETTGEASKAKCIKASAGAGGSTTGGTKGTVTYGVGSLPGTATVFYRVTVRVVGPRNTKSFVQAVLN